MKGDEYDFFLDGLAGYMLRVYFPRVCGAMEAFKLLPPLSSLGYSYRGALTLAEALIKPEIATAIETLQKIGSELERWRSRMDSFGDEIEKWASRNIIRAQPGLLLIQYPIFFGECMERCLTCIGSRISFSRHVKEYTGG